MTFEQLSQTIEQASWFSNLGNYRPGAGQVAIPSLQVWVDEEGHCPEEQRLIAADMEWLPAQANDPDPIHADRLPDGEASLAFYKQALHSLQGVGPKALLQAGAHNFQHVAQGAAAFACRRAALEIQQDCPGFWCQVVDLYAAGHWPCGRLSDGSLVVL